MCADDASFDSFEDAVRAIAREVSRSVERVTNADLNGIADAIGLDPTRAREWIETAEQWLRAQGASPIHEEEPSGGARPTGTATAEDPLESAGPHPLDLPTDEQGLALAALDSGRWTVEPGSNALAAHGDGPGPSDALGLVRELRARDWIAADGAVTLVGRHALSRWLNAADR